MQVTDPDVRFDATTAKTHSFFDGIEWDKLETTTPPPITTKGNLLFLFIFLFHGYYVF